MTGQDLIGRESAPLTTRIEEDAVRRFAEAIGTPYSGLVPPTFVMTLKSSGIPGMDSSRAGMIHGTQEFNYYQPIEVGNVLTLTQRVKDVFQRAGKLGQMTFIVQETLGHNLVGELVFSSCSTLIVPEKEGKNETS